MRVSIIIRVLINAVALGAAVFLIDGLNVGTTSTSEAVIAYIALGALFGVVNAVIKPIVKTVGCAFYILTLGLISLVVNALLLLLTGWLAGMLGLAFTIDGFWPAFWGAIVISVVSWVLSLLLPGKDSDED
ncbi:phage holin family protein [Streptomonospora arabica]|uniref:Phage holin family protein n=1 Tax=Streptomonospora halophila TaxID=427369 RepID=A0ABP9G9A1_9ACTN